MSWAAQQVIMGLRALTARCENLIADWLSGAAASATNPRPASAPRKSPGHICRG